MQKGLLGAWVLWALALVAPISLLAQEQTRPYYGLMRWKRSR